MKDEQQEFLDSYYGKNHMEDHLYLDIEKRARKRYNKLFEDGMKTEHERMEDLKTKLAKEFKIGVKGIKVVIEEFGGTTEELYFHVAKSQGINTDTLNKLNEFKR